LHQKLIADLTGPYRLPSIASGYDFTKDGGLMDYVANMMWSADTDNQQRRSHSQGFETRRSSCAGAN
jgi:hypothetical protein